MEEGVTEVGLYADSEPHPQKHYPSRLRNQQAKKRFVPNDICNCKNKAFIAASSE
jgi:hypothetical protein